MSDFDLELPERCFWIRHRRDGDVFVPGCYGAAVAGPEGCTCDGSPDDPRDKLAAERARAQRAEARADRLAEQLREARAQVRRLRQKYEPPPPRPPLRSLPFVPPLKRDR